MQVNMLKSKLHRATVTDADLNYEGSITIDAHLCEMAQIHPYEKVEVYNINNGARFATYVIFGQRGQVCLNGAAARHVHYGDKIIICSYCQLEIDELAKHQPAVILLDDNNQAKILTGKQSPPG